MVQMRSGLGGGQQAPDRGRGWGQGRPGGVDRCDQSHRASSYASSFALRVEVEDS